MVQEVNAKRMEIRPGREIFCRHWKIGNPKARPSFRLICVHGTAASHEQYLKLLEALDVQLEQNNQKMVECWMYDALGWGGSYASTLPKDRAAYSDTEQVQDLQALWTRHIDAGDKLPTVFMGHSYGPNWIYKFLLHPETPSISVKGFVLLASSLKNPKYQLQTGGPPIFKLPLWLLNCIQPFMTKTFLKIGYAKATHERRPEVIAAAKSSSNQNDMRMVVHYYSNHDWVDTDTIALIRERFCDKALVLHGVEDQVIPVECGQQLANAWKVPLTEVPETSHVLHLEQPEQVATLIMEYWHDLL